MEENVSPEALLKGHRKMRGPVQVVPFETEGGSAPVRSRDSAMGVLRRPE